MKITMNCLLLLLIFVMVSCASRQIQPLQPEEYLDIIGFSAKSPSTEGWVVMKKNRKNISIGKPTSEGKYHTIRASLTVMDIGENSLLPFVKSALAKPEPRFKNTISSISEKKLNAMDCVFYKLTTEDHNVPVAPEKIFIIIGEGYFCAHPDFPKKQVAWIDFSQRFLNSEQPLSTELESSTFLRSLNFELLNH